MNFILIKTLKIKKLRILYPIRRLEFRSEIYNSDRNYGFPIRNPFFQSELSLILTFNYKKVPIKIKIFHWVLKTKIKLLKRTV